MSAETISTPCSLISYQSSEPLYATIKPARYWLMLEYDRPIGRKALPESDLPQSVKAHLEAQSQALESSRVLLVRQQPRQVSGGPRFFLAVADEISPVLYEFELTDYDSLLSLDLAAMISQPEQLQQFQRLRPLFLVCTNGKRDPCCAMNGLPVYQRLEAAFGADIWQTSHVGGHRLSANLVCMPHGLFYGRVDASAGPELVQAYHEGHLLPAYYRGRACYSKIEQAAEFFIRQELKLLELKRLRMIRSQSMNKGEHTVTFLDTFQDTEHTARIKVNPAGFEVLSSCGDAQPGPVPAYTLLSLS